MRSPTSTDFSTTTPGAVLADPDLDEAALALLYELQTSELLTRHCCMCRLLCSGHFYRLGARRLHAVADALDGRRWRVRPLQEALRQLAELAAIAELGLNGSASSEEPRLRSAAAGQFGHARDVLVVAFQGCMEVHFSGSRRRCAC